ncbi:hypothetical protein RRF57_005263 [Xylaria bambusicola]|uniref:Uncharacterized protein n=1 Tax=Xylaria bambusicola TaxID=326684 RepID=A0AAN7UHM5_9PEZI
MLFISLILATLFAVIVETEATCYDTGGSIHDNFVPCNAAAEVSVCCGRNDYCLDNGLCLDAGGDNIFTVQGCTSQTWEAPCKQYCPGLPREFENILDAS